MSDPNILYLSVEQARNIDRIASERLGIPSVLLMENAGKNCAQHIAASKPKSVLIFCGPGNNGGDGFVIARHLAVLGVALRVVCLAAVDRLPPDALLNFQIARNLGIDLHACETPELLGNVLQRSDFIEPDCIVDAILGTGSRGNPRPPCDSAIMWANQQPSQRIAIDLPTGLDADTGECATISFHADITLTFIGQKKGFLANSAKRILGEIRVVDIGFRYEALAQILGTPA